ncbi:MAG TPA: pyridoxamine 5'-phosphate oxidase [Chitinophagaceae bacterium]|nr:pyridoxamine 5'-phosphate oxidase [Chitinophagaceae bacterium]
MRKDYRLSSLDERSAAPDPITQFSHWLSEALAAGVPEPNAMILATVGKNGRPSARVLLLKGVNERGFAFYTDYGSRKGRELKENPFASLVFLWKEVERQVRVEGKVIRMGEKESDQYFHSRPEGSQISAVASLQSRPLKDRAALEAAVAQVAERFRGKPIPRPDRWGGFLLQPTLFEFWQGRPDRLHDRLEYIRSRKGWKIRRLSP